ncbi:hypothetical protein M3215_18955 [Bacillus cytotoxicus]|uniref:Uncharacterized protein n=1 Tax=Bacillus cytotoxicus TaxID=580165 RepID=A0ACC6AD04_9BACI|nr:hypothetical protein [Bacillus cytotoxicus]
MKNYVTKVGAFALASAILIPSTVSYGETLSITSTTLPSTTLPSTDSISTKIMNNRPVDTEKVFMQTFDKDGNVVKTYSKVEAEQLQQHKQNNILYGVNTYDFGATSFSSNKWIRGGTSFYRPLSVWVDAKYRTSGLGVAVYANNKYMGETVIWGTFDGGFDIGISRHLVGYEDYYSLKLNNHDGGTIYLNGGQVYYN